MWIIFFVYFIIVSTIFVPFKVPDQWFVPKEAAFFVIGIIYIFSSYIVDNRKNFRFKNKWIFAAAVYTLIMFFFSFYAPIVFNNGLGYELHVWNLRPTLNFIVGVLLIQTLVENTDSFKRWIDLSRIMAWMGFLVSCYSIIQWIGIDPFINLSKYRYIFRNSIFEQNIMMIGFLGNKMLTSNYIAVLSPMCLLFKELRYKIFYIVMFLAIILTDTTVSFFVFVTGFLMFLLISGRVKDFIFYIFSGGVILGLICAIYSNFLSTTGRFSLWVEIIKDWAGNGRSFFGSGLGGFAASGFSSGGKKVLQAHNEFLQIPYDGGIPILVIFIGFLSYLFYRLFLVYKQERTALFTVYTSAFIGYLILCFGSFPLRIAPLALIGIIYIACLETLILNRGIK